EDLAGAGHVVVEMLQQVERGDRVERLVPERQPLGARLGHRAEAALAAELQRPRLQVKADGVADPCQLCKVAPGSASQVEDSGPRSSAMPERVVAQDSPELVKDDGAAPDEPPVGIFNLVRRLVEAQIH